MAKSRRGRVPAPRVTDFFYDGERRDQLKHNELFQTFIRVFKLARPMKVNEAINSAKYLLRTLNIGDDVQTSVWASGTGYDYTLNIALDEAVLQVERGRPEMKAVA